MYIEDISNKTLKFVYATVNTFECDILQKKKTVEVLCLKIQCINL